MNVDGACLCGAIVFEATVDPAFVFVCHCTDCQTHSGGSFRTIVRAEPGSFKISTGQIKTFVKTAESGRRRTLAFCPECGTPIYGGPGPDEEGFLSLRVGPIHQSKALRPRAQVWARSAQPWIDELHDLPKVEMQANPRRSSLSDHE
jgi:hypothetical protein